LFNVIISFPGQDFIYLFLKALVKVEYLIYRGSTPGRIKNI